MKPMFRIRNTVSRFTAVPELTEVNASPMPWEAKGHQLWP